MLEGIIQRRMVQVSREAGKQGSREVDIPLGCDAAVDIDDPNKCSFWPPSWGLKVNPLETLIARSDAEIHAGIDRRLTGALLLRRLAREPKERIVYHYRASKSLRTAFAYNLPGGGTKAAEARIGIRVHDSLKCAALPYNDTRDLETRLQESTSFVYQLVADPVHAHLVWVFELAHCSAVEASDPEVESRSQAVDWNRGNCRPTTKLRQHRFIASGVDVLTGLRAHFEVGCQSKDVGGKDILGNRNVYFAYALDMAGSLAAASASQIQPDQYGSPLAEVATIISPSGISETSQCEENRRSSATLRTAQEESCPCSPMMSSTQEGGEHPSLGMLNDEHGTSKKMEYLDLLATWMDHDQWGTEQADRVVISVSTTLGSEAKDFYTNYGIKRTRSDAWDAKTESWYKKNLSFKPGKYELSLRLHGFTSVVVQAHAPHVRRMHQGRGLQPMFYAMARYQAFLSDKPEALRALAPNCASNPLHFDVDQGLAYFWDFHDPKAWLEKHCLSDIEAWLKQNNSF